MKARPSWQLGTVLPALMVVALVVDLTSRFIPIDPFTIRSWEAARRYRLVDAPFEANRYYHNDRTFGFLSTLGNLPEIRQYHSETFTTDAYGFRNLPSVTDGRPIDAILLGTSFSIGTGVDDDQTLSYRLTVLTGRTVYNAATQAGQPLPPSHIRAISRRLPMRKRWVIYEYIEAWPPASNTLDVYSPCRELLVNKMPALLSRTGVPAKLAASPGRLYNLCGLFQFAPLQILAQRGYKALQNDRILPNIYAEQVISRRLRNGRTMLFLPDNVKQFHEYRSKTEVVSYFTWLERELRQEQLALLIVLVPTAYTVYQPLLEDPEPRSGDGPEYLDAVERALRSAGILVVNVSPTFRRQAALDLDRDEYLYWLDDSHWNTRGIALAAAEVARVWDP